jgi:hypothetical protein
MEEILDQYARPEEGGIPLICMDEAAPQVLGDGVEPLPAQPGQVRREDYHYERLGTRALFLFFQPQAGWRRLSVREHRTRQDWAEEVRRLLEEDFPDAPRVRLVCDNLNTHNTASLYQAFEPAVAFRLAQRLEIHYTPRNGSWLNVAEIELSALQRQCLEQRFESVEQFEEEIQAWTVERNAQRCRVHWRFTVSEARQKLAHLYPHPDSDKLE